MTENARQTRRSCGERHELTALVLPNTSAVMHGVLATDILPFSYLYAL